MGIAGVTLLAVPVPAHAAPFVVTDLDGGATAEGLAQSLAASGVTVSNVTYTGANASAGQFSGGSGIIGFNEGIVLSSGRAADLGTANTDNGLSVDTGQPGDADLTALSGFETLNATVLEFDVTPNDDTIFFNYVFASEEYNEFVGSEFNDVFGFFVTQQGAASPVNCAVVGAGDPVSVNTINNGEANDGVGASNPGLFVNNDTGAIGAEPDGFTTTLQCTATVTPGVPNHLKLAIADASDADLDSWVFIQARSLSTNSEVCDDGVDNDGDGAVDAADPDCGPPPATTPDGTAAPAQPVVASPKFTG
ncbi:MAG TPA: choice-of-anchor L domain-containing protein [Acidimicrobiales bacterium]|nr:choice-of-anchor L domain-containing protein [Acidimicrobiales bacterium]